MKLTSHAAPQLVAAAITCTAILLPAAALASAGPAATAASPASAARPAHPVTAYVASFAGVTPINTATNKAGTPIKAGSGPFAIAITPDGKTAYVANADSGTVTPIRTATNKALKAIKVGVGPTDIAITPDGKTAYVSNDGIGETLGHTVTPIRTATNKALKAIKVGRAPAAHRDHPGREDRLRRQHRLRHGDPDPDRHQQGPQGDQGREQPVRDRDHPEREDRLRRQYRPRTR